MGGMDEEGQGVPADLLAAEGLDLAGGLKWLGGEGEVAAAWGDLLAGGQGVGDRHPQVVVAVDGDHGLVDVGHALEDVADEVGELLRDGVAHGVRDVDGGGAGLDDLLQHLVDVLGLGAAGVHGAELHVGGVALGAGHHRQADACVAAGGLQDRLLRGQVAARLGGVHPVEGAAVLE